jgi:hypothetical protein
MFGQDTAHLDTIFTLNVAPSFRVYAMSGGFIPVDEDVPGDEVFGYVTVYAMSVSHAVELITRHWHVCQDNRLWVSLPGDDLRSYGADGGQGAAWIETIWSH